MMAAASGNSELVNLIIKLEGDVCATNSQGKTALMMAAEAGHTDIVVLLQDSDAVKDAAHDQGDAV